MPGNGSRLHGQSAEKSGAAASAFYDRVNIFPFGDATVMSNLSLVVEAHGYVSVNDLDREVRAGIQSSPFVDFKLFKLCRPA
jgi:hypothetical protein